MQQLFLTICTETIHFYVAVGDPYVCIFRPVGGNQLKLVYKMKLANTAIGNHTQLLECPWQICQGDIIGLQTHAGSSAIGIGFCQQSSHDVQLCADGTYHIINSVGSSTEGFIQGGIYNVPTASTYRKFAISVLFD